MKSLVRYSPYVYPAPVPDGMVGKLWRAGMTGDPQGEYLRADEVLPLLERALELAEKIVAQAEGRTK